MCKRCKRGVKRKEKKRKTKVKKKRTCCQKCRRKIRKWLCRKIQRCFKKTIFGDPDPQLDDFEIAGLNLGDIRDQMKRNKSKKSIRKEKEIIIQEKPTVVTIFRKNQNKSTKNIPIKDLLMDEYDKYSISKSIGNKVKSFIDDFRERNLSLGLSKDSKLNIDRDEILRNLAEKNFVLSPSKSVIFRNMINDYKKGYFSLSSLRNKRIINFNDLTSHDLNKILAQYETQKKKNGGFVKGIRESKSAKKNDSKYNNFSIKNLELVKNMNSNELKKKFSLSNSKQKMLGTMVDDYKKGKISLSVMRRDLKNDLNIINKENLNQILDYYKKKKSKLYLIVKHSKFKQLKSDLRENISKYKNKFLKLQ